MTNAEKVYRVLLEHPRGVFANTLAPLADVPRHNLSSLIGKAQHFCPHGKRIEGETTHQGGFWQTRYKIVKDYNVGEAQVEIPVDTD